MNGVSRAFILGGQRGMPAVVSLPEAASQSATYRGMLVKLVEDSGDNYRPKVTVVSDSSTDKIYGMMLQDCTGTEDSMVLVQPLTNNVRFVMSVDTTLVHDFVGAAFEVLASGDYHVLDGTHTSNNTYDSGGTDGEESVVVVGMYDPPDTAYGRAICVVRSGFSQYDNPA